MAHGTESFVGLESASRSGAHYVDLINQLGHGLHAILTITEIPPDVSVHAIVQGYDPACNDYYDILVGEQLSDVGQVILKVYPGITEAAGISVSDGLPLDYRVAVVIDPDDTVTYSLGINTLT